MQKISLIGQMGSGKSSLGRQLALHLQWPHVDLDDAIEAQAQQTISEIFQSQGEAAFRDLEWQLLQRTLQRPGPLILSTGGGTPTLPGAMTLLLEGTACYWLDIPPAQLAERLADARDNRPLLHTHQGPALTAFLERQRAERLPFYRQAPHHLDAQAPLDALVSQILNRHAPS